MTEYEVLALRYAENRTQRAPHNFIDGNAHDHAMPLDYFMWLVRGGGRQWLVDTGFDQQAADERGRTRFAGPDALLQLAGTSADAIEDIIITHLHYDHAGNRTLFPHARFHLQEREMAFATGRCMCHDALRAPFDGRDIAGMVMRVFEGRVQYHDGVSILAPGLELHRIGGHTDGLQIVRVWTRRGWVVLASDASHFYANMEQGRSFPIVYNLGDMYDGHRHCHSLADHPANVIPGHDPLVCARYPALVPERIYRLDADPL